MKLPKNQRPRNLRMIRLRLKRPKKHQSRLKNSPKKMFNPNQRR